MLYALGNSSSIFILFQRDVVVAAGFNIIYVKSESYRIKKRFIAFHKFNFTLNYSELGLIVNSPIATYEQAFY